MKIVKHILLFIFSLFPLGLYAEEEADTTNIQLIDPLYFQLYAGINKSANENLPWSEFSKYPWSGGVFFGIGKEWTPLWGWRTALRFNHNKSRNVPPCEYSDVWGWHSVEAFADATIDLTDSNCKRKPREQRPPFNLKLFGGIGAAYTFAFPKDVPLSYTVAYSKNSTVCFAFRLGLTATYALSKNWLLGAELSHSFFIDHFNGVKDGAPLDMRSNLKLGFTYMLVPRSKKQIEPAFPVNYDSRLRTIPTLPLLNPDPEEGKVRCLKGRAFLDFPVNETVIYPDYRRNPDELKRINNTIDSALFDPSFEVLSITLHGYASPESPYANNTRLAQGRTEALKAYLQGKYNLPAAIFTTAFTPEDWPNLRSFIAAGNRRRVKGDIWYESAAILETPIAPPAVLRHSEELLAVIDSVVDPDEKERLLKKIGGGEPYKWLLKHVYPGLRHTDYVIEYTVRAYSNAEARQLIYTHPEVLSHLEMFSVAQSYDEGSDDWRDALLIAAERFPTDSLANYNAACACIHSRRLQDARKYLKKAGTGEEVQYLNDVMDAMEGKVKWKLRDDNYLEILK